MTLTVLNLASKKTVLGDMKAKNKDNSSQIKFLTSKAWTACIQLHKAFTKTLILYYYLLVGYIQIETDFSHYTMGGVLSQIISNQQLFFH